MDAYHCHYCGADTGVIQTRTYVDGRYTVRAECRSVEGCEARREAARYRERMEVGR